MRIDVRLDLFRAGFEGGYAARRQGHQRGVDDAPEDRIDPLEAGWLSGWDAASDEGPLSPVRWKVAVLMWEEAVGP